MKIGRPASLGPELFIVDGKWKDYFITWQEDGSAQLYVQEELAGERPSLEEIEKHRETRSCEVMDGKGEWTKIPFQQLRPGRMFRLFEPSGEPVVDKLCGVTRWVCLGVPHVKDGVFGVQADPVTDTETLKTIPEKG